MPSNRHSKPTLPPQGPVAHSRDGSFVRSGDTRLESSPYNCSPNSTSSTSERYQQRSDVGKSEKKSRTKPSTAYKLDQEAINSVKSVRRGEGEEEKWHRSLKQYKQRKPACTSMEIQKGNGRSTSSTGSSSTRKASTKGTSIGDGEVELEEDNAEIFPPQELGDIVYGTVYRPLPTHIVGQACEHAKQSTGTLTEEEFQNFQQQPAEARKRALDIYFRNLADLGPEFGVDRRLSEEELFRGTGQGDRARQT